MSLTEGHLRSSSTSKSWNSPPMTFRLLVQLKTQQKQNKIKWPISGVIVLRETTLAQYLISYVFNTAIMPGILYNEHVA